MAQGRLDSVLYLGAASRNFITFMNSLRLVVCAALQLGLRGGRLGRGIQVNSHLARLETVAEEDDLHGQVVPARLAMMYKECANWYPYLYRLEKGAGSVNKARTCSSLRPPRAFLTR